MRNKPVDWSEGMFLRPHHFQAAERHTNERIKIGEQWDHPYNYGIRSIRISQDAIANYQVEIAACHVRMRDGTLVDLDIGEAPDRVGIKEGIQDLRLALADLQAAFSNETVVRVYLAIPVLKLGRSNVGRIGQAEHQRYLENELVIPDECQGGNDQAMTFRDLNVKILLSTQDTSGYELMPVAQIKRSGDEASSPVIDDDYFPPLLAVDAWPPLGIDIIRAIYDFLGQQQERIAEHVVNRGISLASQDPADVDEVFKLHFLNEAYATLRCLAFSTGMHPFTVYTELCRIVARLGILTKARRMPEAPLYDHDNLAPIFQWIKAQIEAVFYTPDQQTYEQRYFEGYGNGMQVSLDPKWLLENWDWYVGVARGGFSERACRALLTPGELNWKMGSAKRVDFYFDRRAPGLRLEPLAQAPRILPTTGGWIYYKVDKQTHEFKEVQQDKTLAMRFSKDYVDNWEELHGKRGLVVTYDKKQSQLEFALFAVKRS